MDLKLRASVTQEVIRIGDELLSRAKEDKNGTYWECMSIGRDKEVTWHTGEGIYSGISGIVLFLMQLHRQTSEERFLKAAEKSLNWTLSYAREEQTDYYAFHTGRMGLAYALLEFGKYKDTKEYLDHSINIAKESLVFLDAPRTGDDLLNGMAGTLLGITHIYAESLDETLLPIMEAYLKKILENAALGKKGLYWDRSHQHIIGLCGFSHGAAGVGFVFLELARFFNSKALYWLADQAFIYENAHFSEQNKNWPDFRNGVFDEESYTEHKKEFIAGNLEFFTKGSDMNAWCHGAAGIGLSRVRAYELTKNEQYAKDLANSIIKTKMTNVDWEHPGQTFTLCHGGGGNADLFIEAYESSKDERYLELAEKVGQMALASKEQEGMYYPGFSQTREHEDNSLFMGNAGVGYFYLRLLDPENTPSVLAPKLKRNLEGVDVQSYPHLSLTEIGAKKMMIGKAFPRTLWFSEMYLKDGLNAYLKDEREENKENTIGSFVRWFSGLSDLGEQAADIFSMEKQKLEVEHQVKGHSLLYIKHSVNSEKARELVGNDANAIRSELLQVDPEVHIEKMKWHWPLGEQAVWKENLKKQEEGHFVLFQPTFAEVLEYRLEPFTYNIIACFEEPATIEEVVPEVISSFDNVNDEQRKQIEQAVFQQVQNLLLSGVLLFKEYAEKMKDPA